MASYYKIKGDNKSTQISTSSNPICNGAELGGATGAMAPLVFWSRSIKSLEKSRNQSLVVLSGTSCFYLRSAPMIMHKTQRMELNIKECNLGKSHS